MSSAYWQIASRSNVQIKMVVKSLFDARETFYAVVDVQDSVALCVELEKVFDDEYRQVYSEASLREATEGEKKTNYSFHFRFDDRGVLRSGSDCLYVQSNTVESVSTSFLSAGAIFCRLCNVANCGTRRTGPLAYYGPVQCAEDVQNRFWIHAYCYSCSARKPKEVVDSFLARCLKMSCSFCKHKGASMGCYDTKCRQNFHLSCAEKSNGEFIPETGRLYCQRHADDFCLENRIAVQYPSGSEAQYTRQSIWTAISQEHRDILALYSENYQTSPALWFQRIFSNFVIVKQIFAGHVAFSNEYSSIGKPQYEVVANVDIFAGEIIGEYVGQVMYASQQSQDSDYCALVLIPDVLANRIPPMVIDSCRYGNEMRYINSVAPWTPEDVKENVVLVTYMYDGVPRILVQAKQDIAAGSSLWLNYGKDFFEDAK